MQITLQIVPCAVAFAIALDAGETPRMVVSTRCMHALQQKNGSYIYILTENDTHTYIQIKIFIFMYMTVHTTYNIVSHALAFAIPPGPGETTRMAVSTWCIHMIFLFFKKSCIYTENETYIYLYICMHVNYNVSNITYSTMRLGFCHSSRSWRNKKKSYSYIDI